MISKRKINEYQEKKQNRYPKKLCIHCGIPNDRYPLTYCTKCAEIRKKYSKKFRARRYADKQCVVCGKPNDRYPQTTCSLCRERSNNWVKENKDLHLKRRAKWARSVKKEVVDLFGGKCELCGYNKSLAALDFHHINFDGKDDSKGWKRLTDIRDGKITREKIQLLCANCHREIHDVRDLCDKEESL